MATYKDIEMLNSSLDRLGDSLLKNRMLADQKSERETARTERTAADTENTRRFDLTRADTEAYRTKQLGETTKANAETIRQNARRVWRDNATMIGGWVKDEIMPADKASALLTDAYGKLPDDAKAELAEESTVRALLAGQSLFQAPPRKQTGEFNVRETALLERELKLEAAVKAAKQNGDAGALVEAEHALAKWNEIRGNSDDTETVTERDEINPDTGLMEKRQSVSYKRKRGGATAAAPTSPHVPSMGGRAMADAESMPTAGKAKPAQQIADQANAVWRELRAANPEWSPTQLDAAVKQKIRGESPAATAAAASQPSTEWSIDAFIEKPSARNLQSFSADYIRNLDAQLADMEPTGTSVGWEAHGKTLTARARIRKAREFLRRGLNANFGLPELGS